ncbi:META domain-containing protein [Sandarakinorhabdus sp.]|jgi:heat shock protein HslJ|uniref:META domain-containing protein n=1 Tax=Sandarakinorhabdus sp. TaxID=1916663 RepID=UPI0028AB6C01|nr:META domain-containing protein [Sandarakinorhabdus sp.]
MRAALLLPLALLALAGCRDQRQQLGQALSGKPPVIAGSLEGEWQIEDLNGGGPVAQSRLMFDPGDQGTSRLSGTAGCNRFSGNWKQDGATLQLGPMAATRMACPPPAMEIEQRVLALLEAVISVTYTADGAAILATPDGRKLTLTRPPKA